MVAAEAYGDRMKTIANHREQPFPLAVRGFSLSRPWLVPARLGWLFTQAVATATPCAPERRPDAPARRQEPRSTMNQAGR